MKRQSFTILVGLIVSVSAALGQSNTMYYHPGVPHTYYLNPASQPECNIFIGIPVLSSIYNESYSNSLHLTDLIWNDPETGEAIYPGHPNADLDEFFSQLEDDLVLETNLDFTPLSFGFRVQNLYFTFDVTARSKTYLSTPTDLAQFAMMGGPDNTLYDFSALGLELTSHIEYAIGISRKFGDLINVGIRPKLLTGAAHLSSLNNDISLYTSHEEWQFDTHMEIEMCTPGFNVPTSGDGTFDPEGEFTPDTTLDMNRFSGYRKLALANPGFGIDFGVHFKPVDQFTLSASVLDIGFINWKKYTNSFTLDGSYTFEGLEYDPLNDSTDYIGTLLDSIKSDFVVTGSESAFRTTLTPKIYVGVNYALTRKVNFSVLSRFDLPESGIKTKLILLANWQPSSTFALTLSYTPVGGQLSTFGTALSWRAGFISFYSAFDYRALKYTMYTYKEDNFLHKDIPVFFAPSNRSRVNVSFGMNIVIGSNHKKKLMKDKPMYYSGDY